MQAAAFFTTAIVTGRSKDKIYDFVGLDGVFYAGSHGLEIQGPRDTPVNCQVREEQHVATSGPPSALRRLQTASVARQNLSWPTYRLELLVRAAVASVL